MQITEKTQRLPDVPSCNNSLGIFSWTELHSDSSVQPRQTFSDCSAQYPNSSKLQQNQT